MIFNEYNIKKIESNIKKNNRIPYIEILILLLCFGYLYIYNTKNIFIIATIIYFTSSKITIKLSDKRVTNRIDEFNKEIIQFQPVIKINDNATITVVKNNKTVHLENIISLDVKNYYAKSNITHIKCEVYDENSNFIDNIYSFSNYMINYDVFKQYLKLIIYINRSKNYSNNIIKYLLSSNEKENISILFDEIANSTFFIPYKFKNINHEIVRNISSSKTRFFDFYISEQNEILLYTSYEEYQNKFPTHIYLYLISFSELMDYFEVLHWENSKQNNILTNKNELNFILNIDSNNIKFSYEQFLAIYKQKEETLHNY